MTEHVQLDLGVVLPDAPGEEDRCVDRLIGNVKELDGVSAAHVVGAVNGDDAQLCVHYDPDIVGLTRLRDVVKQSGAAITQQYGHIVCKVAGLRHERQVNTIETQIKTKQGVMEVGLSGDGILRVEYDRKKINEEQVKEWIEATGVTIEQVLVIQQGTVKGEDVYEHKDHEHGHDHPHKHEHAGGCGCGSGHSHGGILGEKSELIYAITSGVCLIIGMIFIWFTPLPYWVALIPLLGAYYFGGWYTLKDAIASIKVGRFEIDLLMLVAAIGAAYLGEFPEGAFLLFLFSFGHSLEHYAMGRARRAIEGLAQLTPTVARVRREGGKEEEIAIDQVKVCDVVVVKPDERIAVDGVVIEGNSNVDQSPVTGESIPVEKVAVTDVNAVAADSNIAGKENRVFAGTINGNGAMAVMVTRRAGDSTLSRLIRMVNEAETQKSKTQKITAGFEKYYVPCVIVFVFLLLFTWVIFPEGFDSSLYRAIAVLVAASPCALAIATPSAVLSGIARAARGGILVKGGGPLENMSEVEIVAFDKTGTLTEGKPRLTDVRACATSDEEELLRYAVGVEKQSQHPLAQAVVRDGNERLGDKSGREMKVTDVQSITGFGVVGKVKGKDVAVGKLALFESDEWRKLVGEKTEVEGLVRELEAEGRTTMVVYGNDRFLGVIGLMDEPREQAKTALERLRAIGVSRQVMLTGDNQRVADAIAGELGIDEAKGDLLPEDKVAAVKGLRDEGQVAMVGDGVNDAPAMAGATVGIAMGAAGSDVALETAEVALMSDRLEMLPTAIGLSRKSKMIIRQNLWISMGMVAVLIPATLFGLEIGPAVVLHEGSTVFVVFNALRLLGYRG
ncbi:heavy metal translocating P-type ATPase [Planctomycetota bacterium]|nr:heavy metal translocating P-type ATPase [Planctomycetota bacterium]